MLDCTQYFPEEPHALLFVSIAFAYNLPFTAMGSLIHYYSDKYGSSFFVYLNVAYYSTGLPTSILRRKADTYFDTLYGSILTFRVRMYTSMFALVFLVLLIPLSDFTSLIIISLFIGIFNWLSHGSATTLASIVQKKSSTYQLIGFMFPGVVCIILVLAFNVSDADSLGLEELYVYYGVVAMCCLQGIYAWYVLCRSDFVLNSLAANDNKVSGLILKQDIEQRYNGQIKNHGTLKDVIKENDLGEMKNDAYDASKLRMDLRSKSRSSDVCSGEVISPLNRLGNGSNNHTFRENHGRMESLAIDDESRYSFTDYNRLSMNALIRITAVKDAIKGIIEAQPDIAYKTTENGDLVRIVGIYRWTLFLLIYCSILEASFFSYVPSQPNSSLYLGSILYFVRVFSDFLGRAVALAYSSPYFLKIHRIYTCVVIRCVLMLVFFAYIMMPAEYFFRNDYFIIVYQVNSSCPICFHVMYVPMLSSIYI